MYRLTAAVFAFTAIADALPKAQLSSNVQALGRRQYDVCIAVGGDGIAQLCDSGNDQLQKREENLARRQLIVCVAIDGDGVAQLCEPSAAQIKKRSETLFRRQWNVCIAVDGDGTAQLCESDDEQLHKRQVNACVGVDGDGVVQECEPVYSVDPSGQTVVAAPAGTVTLPTGLADPTTATFSDGGVTTITPSDIVIQTTDDSGNTIISNANSAITIPSGLTTTLEIVLPNGQTTTIVPPSDAAASDEAQTTVFDDQTVISQGGSAITIPTGLTTPIVTTLPDGESTTITFTAPETTGGEGTTGEETTAISTDFSTTTTDGVTIIYGEEGTITLPTGVTTPLETTLPGGSLTTISPPAEEEDPSTTTNIGPIIFPITTSVDQPKATDGGTVIPCSLWFFSTCIQWDEFPILGWEFDIPPGVRPPGPPPPFSIDPELHISIGVQGTLPPWPEIEIGPDGNPTFSSEPPEECETQTAELCVTSTSYVVSPSDNPTTTISSDVLSTCATVQGCGVEDDQSETTTTSTASCSETACAACVDWDAITYDATQYGDTDPDGGSVDAAAPVARAVSPEPVQTRHATTLVKRAKTLVDAVIPTTTPAPRMVLYRRTVSDERESSTLGRCPLNSVMTFGSYIDLNEFTDAAYADASKYFVMSRRSSEVSSSTDDVGVTQAFTTCYAGYIYSTDDYSHASRAANDPTYGSPGGGNINADHVYEQQLWGYFFDHALSLPGAPDCPTFNKLFVDTGRLQRIFDAGANLNNPDFAALDVYINQKKGTLFQNAGGLPNAPNVVRAANNIQEFGIVSDLMGFDQMISLFRRTHQRLYQLFGEIDNDLQGCGGQPGADPTWAATYSEWMTGFLSSRGSYLNTAASSWYSIVTNQPAPVRSPYTQLLQTYPPEAFDLPVNELASGLSPFTPPANAKRQDACTLDPSETDTSGTDPTTTTGAAEPATTLSDLPTLTTGIVTPSGSSCVSTFIQTECVQGGGGKSACVSTPACGSWTATDEATTTTAADPEPTSTDPPVRVATYKNSDCTEPLDIVELKELGQCFSPEDEDGEPTTFKCISILDVRDDWACGSQVIAHKDAGCASLLDSNREVYSDLPSLIDQNLSPFKMGSFSFNAGDGCQT